MVNLLSRIRKRVLMTINNFRNDCHFSPKLGWYRMVDDLCYRVGLKRISKKYHVKKDEWILSYLSRQLHPVFEEFAEDDYCGEYQENAPIWVCWWTGEETAPPLVKKCIESIRKNAGEHPVYVITESNYEQYIRIPREILEKVNNRSMCIANFSDYLRFSLLAKHGGLWLDATVFCSAFIEEKWFQSSVFTCKGKTGEGKYISDYRWTSFCFGGYRDSLFFRFMQASFEAYWLYNKTAIDYLLVDYLISLGYKNNSRIKEVLDKIDDNNMHRDCLQAAMNAALPATDFDAVVQNDTVFYKLSWRETYSVQTVDGIKSIYAAFLERKI